MSKKHIRIVIAYEHAVLREAVSALLATQEDFQVVGCAANGQEAQTMMEELKPEVLLLDLMLPQPDGFEVLRSLDRAGNRAGVVVLTASENEADYAQAVKLGARGLVLKSDGPEYLFSALRTVASGELAFSDERAQQVLATMGGESHKSTHALSRLSERERQIAYYVARGMKNKDIGHELSISENTVKRHLQSIFTKTGVRDRLELAVMALGETTAAA
jgi:DNA-binding NarL/FixJ family response regulator